MPRHSEIRVLPYTADQMFDVVSDIEHYPEFLPWCSALRILAREAQGDVQCITAEMRISYHGLYEHYVSRVRLDKTARAIEAHHVKGPFERLDNRWRFELLEKGSRIHFFIEFAFKNRLLSAVAGIAFDAVAKRMADAFVERARVLYGATKTAKLA